MSIKYRNLFVLLTVACVASCWLYWPTSKTIGIVFIYFGVSFAIVAAGFGGLGSAIFLKSNAGKTSPIVWAYLGPYLLLSRVSFLFYRLTTRESPYNEIAPGLFLGRRLTSREAEDAIAQFNWAGCIDLAVEFTEAPALRALEGYLSVAVMDATPPDPKQMAQAVNLLLDTVPTRPMYVHCALGHRRSASVIAAYLLASKICPSLDEALTRIQASRPEAALHRLQRNAVMSYVENNSTSKG